MDLNGVWPALRAGKSIRSGAMGDGAFIAADPERPDVRYFKNASLIPMLGETSETVSIHGIFYSGSFSMMPWTAQHSDFFRDDWEVSDLTPPAAPVRDDLAPPSPAIAI